MITEIHEKIWHITSDRPGPVITILGGVHGNERTGIEVVNTLKQDFESGALTLVAGELYLILGNPRAIKLNERGSKQHNDLNRCFHDVILNFEGEVNYEVERARELAPILRASNFVLDLHATNKPSDPMLIVEDLTPAHWQIAKWLSPEIIVTDPHKVIFTHPVAATEYAEQYGALTLAYETGQTIDLTRVQTVWEETVNFLRAEGLVAGEPTTPPFLNKKIFQCSGKIMMTNDGFHFAPGMGENSFQPFKKGEVLGMIKDKPVVAEKDGVFLMPCIKKHWCVGKYITLLAEECPLS